MFTETLQNVAVEGFRGSRTVTPAESILCWECMLNIH